MVLMLVLWPPILFSEVPRKMLYFSVLFPFIGYHLLWGGSVWLPISVLLGVCRGLCGIPGNGEDVVVDQRYCRSRRNVSLVGVPCRTL